jgi:hypothetical protein
LISHSVVSTTGYFLTTCSSKSLIGAMEFVSESDLELARFLRGALILLISRDNFRFPFRNFS